MESLPSLSQIEEAAKQAASQRNQADAKRQERVKRMKVGGSGAGSTFYQLTDSSRLETLGPSALFRFALSRYWP
jgi:hypothetical protein